MQLNNDYTNITPKRFVSDKQREYSPFDKNKENQFSQQQFIRKNNRQYDPSPYKEIKLKNQYKYNDRERKFSYLEEAKTFQNNEQTILYQPTSKKVKQLEYQLQCQRNRYQVLQQRTIESQKELLEQLNNLQDKLTKLRQQKKNHEEELYKLKLQKYSPVLQNSNPNQPSQFQELKKQYKKIKGFGKALIDMRKKVDGVDGDLKDAWRWVKQIVGQYSVIKQHAYEWKKAFNELNREKISKYEQQIE